MGRLPVLKPREVVDRLKALGFVEVRQRGSHKQFRHADGRGTTVLFHSGRDINQLCCGRSPRMSVCRLTSSSAECDFC